MSSFSLHKQVLDATPDGVTIQDRDFNIIYQNRSMKEVFGGRIGLKCYEVYEKRVQVCEECGLIKVFQTGEPNVVHRTAITRDGVECYWENSCFPLFDNEGDIVAGVEVCRNVTNRVSLEENVRKRSIELGKLNDRLNRKSAELEHAYNSLKIVQSRVLQQEELLRAIIEAAPVAIIGLDLDGNVHSVWNRTAERMLGWSANEVMGRPLPTVQVDKAEEFRWFRQQIRKGMTLNGVEVQRQKRDGTPIDYSIYASPLRDAEGDISGNIAVLVDITNRKLLEDQLRSKNEDLERSNAELEQFAYVASHDLQEPLRKVGSYMELVAERYRDQLDQDGRDFIDYAVDGARRMKIMIDDLLKYSRVGTRGKTFAPVDTMKVMHDVLNDLELAIEENDAAVSYDALPVVTADDSQLQQLFRNLIGNALKYRGQNPPRIRVFAERQERAWRFCVTDNGIGIEPRFSEHVFHIFQRLHPRGRYEGTGIGLAVCKKIIERHSGTIGVDSTPGQGSAFYFTIPDLKGKES